LGAAADEAKDEAKKITPLAIAISRGHFDLARYLISKDAVISPLMVYISSKFNDVEMLKYLIDNTKVGGIKLNEK
jgi:hypothetical protein